MNTFEVCFTVYEDKTQMRGNSNLQDLRVIVQAWTSDQAQAMVEAQYNGCAKVSSVTYKTV